MNHARILVIDGNPTTSASTQQSLRSIYDVRVAAAAGAEQICGEYRPDLVIFCTEAEGGTDLERISGFCKTPSEPALIVAHDAHSLNAAAPALRTGASALLAMPFSAEYLQLLVERCLSDRNLAKQLRGHRQELVRQYTYDRFVATKNPTVQLVERAKKISADGADVLIVGEAGCGKRLLGTIVHYNSPRSSGPLVRVNCARFDERTLSSRIFDDAGTGELSALAEASGGSLLLEQVDHASEHLQNQLSKRLASQPHDSPLRLICTAAEDPADAGLSGYFGDRRLELVPLRQRMEELPDLIEHFLRIHFEREGRRCNAVADTVINQLNGHTWPGNIAELKCVLDLALVNHDQPVLEELAQPPMTDASSTLSGRHLAELVKAKGTPGVLTGVRDQFERDLLIAVLDRHRWNKSRTARELGIHRNTLEYRIRRLKVKRPSDIKK